MSVCLPSVSAPLPHSAMTLTGVGTGLGCSIRWVGMRATKRGAGDRNDVVTAARNGDSVATDTGDGGGVAMGVGHGSGVAMDAGE